MAIYFPKHLKVKEIAFSFLLFSLQIYSQTNLSSYVNPFIGTGGHGHTFPGATSPFGMVQLSPDTRIDDSWDGCSGYHYSDSIIYGFSHTHLSGTGCSDLGDILLMPGSNEPSADNKIYSSKFNHCNEKASAGFYEVLLDKNKIKVELTVTPRVGIHRYTFSSPKNNFVVIDLLHRDKTLDCNLKIIDSNTIVGYRISEAWAKKQYVYFVIKFSKAFYRVDFTENKNIIVRHKVHTTNPQGAVLHFNSNQVLAKVGISSVSEEGALLNLNTEAKAWNFEKYKSDAKLVWDNQLKKIEITSASKNNSIFFYTALYHCFIHPSLNMDVDKKYRGRDSVIHTAKNFTNYSVFSLWDTYRALHPLFTIVERERTKDFIASFLNQYKESGRLPVWELWSNETDCMIGYHSVSVIADALVKGIAVRDTQQLYNAMLAATNYSGFGIPTFNQKDFLEIDDENESVSKSLEYAYDDWCIAQVSKLLNKKEDEKVLLKKSQAYKNLFDAGTGFMRPRKNGNWLNPFNATEINNHFTEGNSWQYSFYVPHDVEGLINLHGGNLSFEKKLDELFSTSSKTTGREQADVTGLLGQYAHGNEPSHHMTYLYHFVGKPQKTIALTKSICKNFYTNSPDGLIGNEDCGQMSAWYIFSSLGFYPLCPGSENYILSEPIFDKAVLNLENGRKYIVSNPIPNERFIKCVTLNNKESFNSFITHKSILNGGNLLFVKNKVGDSISKYGQEKINQAVSKVELQNYIPAPIISSETQIFKNKLEIEMDAINAKYVVIVYTLDGTEPNGGSRVYNKPFLIDSTCTIKAKLLSNNVLSETTEAKFYKIKNNFEVELVSQTNKQYSANGANTLIDGIYADANWKKGNWLGLQGKNFEAIIDLKETKTLNYFSLNCLQDTRSWIVFPKEINFYVSETDKQSFKLVGKVVGTIPIEELENKLQKFELKISEKVNTKYVKVEAVNAGLLPNWHQGAGGESYIFCDELEVK